MANKRISELTSITGANLADADLLVVVDVSDTTMASSGTNKKITMSELAKDSALTDNLIAKTTLTTDGDVLTRAAGAPARITRADLAQDSAFSSRYQPITDDFLWISAGEMTATEGASVTSSGLPSAYFVSNVSFGDSATSYALMNIFIPKWWTSFHIDLYWTRGTTAAGDVRWGSWRRAGMADNSNLDVRDSPDGAVTATANAGGYLNVTRVNTSLSPTTDRMMWLQVFRDGGNAADTLAGNVFLLGVRLVRAT